MKTQIIKQHGSKPFSVSLSDGVATLRDAVLIVLAYGVEYLGNTFTDGLPVEVQGAVVVLAYAAIKFGWKFLTDTQRVGAL